MKTRDIVVRGEQGLHLRVASRVVRVVGEHDASVYIQCEGCPRIKACSILGLLKLDAGCGARLQVTAEGPDEDTVVEALAGVFEGGDGI